MWETRDQIQISCGSVAYLIWRHFFFLEKDLIWRHLRYHIEVCVFVNSNAIDRERKHAENIANDFEPFDLGL